MVALLFYGYATGVFSSRKLEEATYDSVAFRYIAANTHPDHETIAHFRKRFLDQLKPLFVVCSSSPKSSDHYRVIRTCLYGGEGFWVVPHPISDGGFCDEEF